jgi:single-strand DNA-binding protein
MNSVILIGNLARDPELSYTPNTQTAVCRFSLAVNRPKKDGEDQGADFIRITVWGKQAENCDRYLAKGRKVAVNGRIQTGSYKDKNGQTVYTTDVVANNVEFLTAAGGDNSASDRRNDARQSNTAPRNDIPPEEEYGFHQVDDDMPY